MSSVYSIDRCFILIPAGDLYETLDCHRVWRILWTAINTLYARHIRFIHFSNASLTVLEKIEQIWRHVRDLRQKLKMINSLITISLRSSILTWNPCQKLQILKSNHGNRFFNLEYRPRKILATSVKFLTVVCHTVPHYLFMDNKNNASCA